MAQSLRPGVRARTHDDAHSLHRGDPFRGKLNPGRIASEPTESEGILVDAHDRSQFTSSPAAKAARCSVLASTGTLASAKTRSRRCGCDCWRAAWSNSSKVSMFISQSAQVAAQFASATG